MDARSPALSTALAVTIAASLPGCPVDDRALLAGAGGTIVITTGGTSSEGAGMAGEGAGGDEPSTGGVAGSSAGSVGDGGDGGTSGTAGSSGTGGVLTCRGARCSCFGDVGNECAGENCCRTTSLPMGSFSLGGGGTGSVDATIEVYGLDKFEVTVGRFRKFVESYLGPPQPEVGQHPWVVASGWQAAWDTSIAGDSEGLRSALSCDATKATWTDELASNEARPMNCVTWFEAFAFCAWDGARLPTEAEWEYAAAGGELSRRFPWGDALLTHERSLYDCGGKAFADCEASDLLPAGSKHSGAGFFEHEDLAGSVSEWVLDWHAPYVDCNNCANVLVGSERVTRGGSFLSVRDVDLETTVRAPEEPAARLPSVGFRCARDD